MKLGSLTNFRASGGSTDCVLMKGRGTPFSPMTIFGVRSCLVGGGGIDPNWYGVSVAVLFGVLSSWAITLDVAGNVNGGSAAGEVTFGAVFMP